MGAEARDSVPRTNLEALLHHSPNRPAHQAAPAKEASRPAKKPAVSPRAGRASKKGARPARLAPKGGNEGGEDGDGAEGSEGDRDNGGEGAKGDRDNRGDGAKGDRGAAQAPEGAAASDEGAAAFARVRPELEALPREEVRAITVNVPAAAMLALGALPKMMALREAMVAELTNPPLDALDKLEDYALVAARAHARALPKADGETNLRALLNEAGPLRERLLLNAGSLASFGLLDAANVASIRQGTGHLDMAQDLSALGMLYLDAWPSLASKTPFERVELERAIALGGLLLKALGRRQQGTDGSGDPVEADEQLAKAYELFRRAYEACRHAIVYLRRNHGDADDIAPPLGHSRRRARAKPAEEPGTDDPDGSGEPEEGEPGSEPDEAATL
jgi:hypothetical protein